MKRISKRLNKDFHKQFQNKSSVFVDGQVISEGGHFVRPSSQASFANEKVQIICKGYGNDATQIANYLLNSLKQPMLSLVNQQCKLSKESQSLIDNDLIEQGRHKYFMLNLIDSCFEELSSKRYDGSCSFAISYIINNTLFIAKNSIMQCYIISKIHNQKHQLKTLDSRDLPFQINSMDNHSNYQKTSSKSTPGFFYCDPNYNNIIAKNYFPEVSLQAIQIPKQENSIFLMGNSECFCHLSEDEIIQIFTNSKNLKLAGQQLIEKSKKRWKTIYQEDMTVIASRFS